MRITPTPVASAPKRVLARRDWRPLTTGEAVVAVVVDFLLLVVVVLVPLLALNLRALPWILLTQVIAVQSLVLARFGRTAGLATGSATGVVPQQGAAPGIGRALARVLLPILLPFQIGRRTSAGQQDEDRERLLDRLTGTMTVTRRPTPKQERRRSAVQTRSEPRRVRRGSKDGAPSPVVPEAATRRRMRDGGRRPSAGSVAAGPPMLQPQAPAVRERPDLAGPVYTDVPAGPSVSVGAGPAAVSDSGAGRSRFAPPVSSPAAPVSSPAPPPAAPSPAVPIPPPDSPPPSSVPAESGPPPATPSVFAAPPGPPPTSSMPTRRVSATRSVSSNAPIPPSAPVEASAPLPPSLPPRIHPGRRKVVPPVPPVSPSDAPASPSVSGAHSTSRGGAPSGASPVSGGVAGSAQDQSPVVPPLAAASPVTPPGPGRLDSSIPSGPISVQPVARRPGRSDAQRRRPKVS